MLESLFQTYDSVIVLDTETTGVNCKSDEIIELGFLRLDRAGERTEEDYLIRLSPGRRLPPVITQLTGIREDELFQNGVEKDVAAEAFVRSLAGEKPLVCAYNAQFDLCFLFYFLHRLGCKRRSFSTSWRSTKTGGTIRTSSATPWRAMALTA